MYPRAYIYFSLALLMVVAAFFPTYFARLGETGTVHHVHGLSATAWFLLLIIQSWLITHRKNAMHRSIGKISFIVAPLIVIAGIGVMRAMMSGDWGDQAFLRPVLLFIDVISLAFFAICYLLAIVNRGDVAIHARCMTATVFAALPPALVRFLLFYIPGVATVEAALHPAMVITELVIVALIIHDYRRYQVRFPYPAALAVFLTMHTLMYPVAATSWWQTFGAWIGGA